MRRVTVAIAVAFTLCLAVPRASVVVPLTLDEMSRQAHLIVDARVLAVHETVETGRVARVVSVRVLARWKGDADDVLHVRLPGGRWGRTQTFVPGVPSMRPDERFVLFLADAPAGGYQVLGLHQGAWRVTPGPVGGAWIVSGVPAESQRPGPVLRGSGTRRPRSLEAFRETVRVLAGEAK